MQRFFEVAFRSAKPSAPDGKNFAILPQQSQDELLVSSVHSKLDRVLQFLQSDIGYVLLDDARPSRGGGVRLTPPPGPLASRAAGPRGARSDRIPKGEPQVDEEETQQVIRFSNNTAKYAQYPDDLVLVYRFTNILANANPACKEMVKQETLYKTVLQGIRLMHLCSYDYSDLVLTLAYASVYFRSTCEAIGHRMSNVEAAHVCVLLIFLAHCFVIDETCPLRYWQKYIFKKYCTLKVLDAALFRVFEMRKFKLRISEEEQKHALSVLLCAESGRDVILSINEGADAGSHARKLSRGTAQDLQATVNNRLEIAISPSNERAASSRAGVNEQLQGSGPSPKDGNDKGSSLSNGHGRGSSAGAGAKAQQGPGPHLGNGHDRGGAGAKAQQGPGPHLGHGHDRGGAHEKSGPSLPRLNNGHDRDASAGVDAKSRGLGKDLLEGSSSTCSTTMSSREETPTEVSTMWSGGSQQPGCRAAAVEELAAARSTDVPVL